MLVFTSFPLLFTNFFIAKNFLFSVWCIIIHGQNSFGVVKLKIKCQLLIVLYNHAIFYFLIAERLCFYLYFFNFNQIKNFALFLVQKSMNLLLILVLLPIFTNFHIFSSLLEFNSVKYCVFFPSLSLSPFPEIWVF